MNKQPGMRQRTKKALGKKWTLKDDIKWLGHVRRQKAVLFPRKTMTIQEVVGDPDFDLLLFNATGQVRLAHALENHELFKGSDYPLIYALDDDLRIKERQYLAWKLYWLARAQGVELIIF